MLNPHLNEGFVHFVKGELQADKTLIKQVLKPNQTTLVEVVWCRIVREGLMRLMRLDNREDAGFARGAAHNDVVDLVWIQSRRSTPSSQ